MVVWNDLEADEKVKVYDKGVNITNREGVYELLVNYRSGDMWAPQLEQVEALRQELSYFVECISTGQEPFNDGCAGLRVVKMLEAASRIIEQERSSCLPMNSYNCIADDVKLGSSVRLSKFINLYGCEIGDETKIGAFVEIQKNAPSASAAKSPAIVLSARAWSSKTTSSSGTESCLSTTVILAQRLPQGDLQTDADWNVERTVIKKGASIGSGATILCNTNIGENAIVGAGSVVTKDVPPNAIVAGNPAKVSTLHRSNHGRFHCAYLRAFPTASLFLTLSLRM